MSRDTGHHGSFDLLICYSAAAASVTSGATRIASSGPASIATCGATRASAGSATSIAPSSATGISTRSSSGIAASSATGVSARSGTCFTSRSAGRVTTSSPASIATRGPASVTSGSRASIAARSPTGVTAGSRASVSTSGSSGVTTCRRTSVTAGCGTSAATSSGAEASPRRVDHRSVTGYNCPRGNSRNPGGNRNKQSATGGRGHSEYLQAHWHLKSHRIGHFTEAGEARARKDALQLGDVLPGHGGRVLSLSKRRGAQERTKSGCGKQCLTHVRPR